MSGINRRALLVASSGAVALPALVRGAGAADAAPGYPFTLGVASGDPAPDGVVLWTRLAPDPLGGGGMPDRRVQVAWRIAHDEAMTRIARQGMAVAEPEWAHSVHVEVDGLDPARVYYYQFRTGSELSPVGRTRTSPPSSAAVNRLRFAFASCQNYPAGYYTAYRHMAEQDLDLVVHLGDYIYEGPNQGSLPDRRHLPELRCRTLEHYRTRHALYKTDADLQAAHAAFPWMVTWDDHEVANNWADEDSDPDAPPETLLRRRAAAAQAYYEHLPLRRTSLPQGPDMLLYRRLRHGDLATFSLLDTRQYRSDQPCGGGIRPRCAEALDPAQTMTGPRQERWLIGGLDTSRTRWNVLAQQTIMAELDFTLGPVQEYQMDNWGGYVAARDRLLTHMATRETRNPVVLGGDIHATFVNDLTLDFADPDAPAVATEFVTTSITSGKGNDARVREALPDNPHVQYYDGSRRGYVRCEVTPQAWTSDLLFVDDVRDPASAVRSHARYVIEDGRPGAHRA